MSNKVTVAAIQMTYGLEEACEKVREAASQGAQIILLPELFENWYFCQEKATRTTISDNTRGKSGGPRDADHCP